MLFDSTFSFSLKSSPKNTVTTETNYVTAITYHKKYLM